MKDVSGDLADIRAVIGEVEVMDWYRKGMPPKVRVSGDSRESFDTTLSGFPVRATSVPRRVRSVCDADSCADNRENGAPRTSKRASVCRE